MQERSDHLPEKPLCLRNLQPLAWSKHTCNAAHQSLDGPPADRSLYDPPLGQHFYLLLFKNRNTRFTERQFPLIGIKHLSNRPDFEYPPRLHPRRLVADRPDEVLGMAG